MPGFDFATQVGGGSLHFNAAHFITLGDRCENLHGHNFHVRLAVRGGNGGDAMVADFVVLEEVAREVCAELHDGVLVPAHNPAVRLDAADGELTVRCADRRFILPEAGCRVLPVANATAEALAWYVAECLSARLSAAALAHAAELEVAVEEADGQWGIHRREMTRGA